MAWRIKNHLRRCVNIPRTGYVLSNIITAANYDGNESTVTAYPVPFDYRDADHVFVDVAAKGSGTVTIDDNGGAVFSVAQEEMQAGHKLWIYGDLLTVVSRTDSTHFVLTAGFPGSSMPFVNVSLPETLQPNEFTLSADGVRTTVAVPVTSRVSIYRRTPSVMETAIPETGKFPAAAVESALDFLTLRVQELQSQVDGTGVSTPAGYAGNVLQDSAVFLDAADRSRSVPKRAGQLGVQTEDDSLWIAQSTVAGSWQKFDAPVQNNIEIISGTATAVSGRSYIAGAPVILTIPPSGVGFEGSLEHRTYGTVGLAFPAGWDVDYLGLAPGATGRPYVTQNGGEIQYRIIAPGRIRISGDYMTGAWLPMDAGDNFLGMWKGGYGHIGGAIGDVSETVPPLTNRSLVWAPLFSPVAQRRFAYPAIYNQSRLDYCPYQEADATAASKVSSVLRTGTTTPRVYTSNFVMATGACHFFMALRMHAINQIGTGVLKLTASTAPVAFPAGIPCGLWWMGQSAGFGYQFVAPNSTGSSLGTKGGVMNTHENTASAVLLSCVVGASGGGTIYSGTTQITGVIPASGAFPISEISFSTNLNSNLLGAAFFNGAPGNLAAAQAYFAAQFIA